MTTPLSELEKIISLEIQRGHDNKAVFGGMSAYFSKWRAKAEFAGIDIDRINKIATVLDSYDLLDPQERSKRTTTAIHLINPMQPSFTVKNNLPITKVKGIPVKKVASQKSVNSKMIKPVEEVGFNAGLTASLATVTGIGEKTAKLFSKLEINTVRDLLFYFPRRYDDYSNLISIASLKYGNEATLTGTLERVYQRTISGGRSTLTEAYLNDGTGSIRLNWFNQPWLKNSLKSGDRIFVSGKVDIFQNHLIMTSPDWEPVNRTNLNTNRIVPVYPSTAGLSQKLLRKHTFNTVKFWSTKIPELLSKDSLDFYQLVGLSEALHSIHFPSSTEALSKAQYRLAFNELLLLQLGVLAQRQQVLASSAKQIKVTDAWLETELSLLPFSLTQAQLKSVNAIRNDLEKGKPMNRLLQGDVGSGKTLVAAVAIASMMVNGHQSAVMAPTSILAEQHFKTFRKLFSGKNCAEDQIALLTGDTSTEERNSIYQGLKSGKIKLIIGTHALIFGDLPFSDFQLVVIDEQHRFGVDQRAEFRKRNDSVHLLVMTATPIPRSLAMTINGDLDLTVMDEMPIGRLPIKTKVVSPGKRATAYTHIRKEIESGHQAFIIYPLVSQGDNDEVLAATEEKVRLQSSIFPDLRIGLLHGRLRPAEKDVTMLQFRDKQLDILVSTSVVEVGVDIPNATVMMVEGANRFGLAQLHQFRGRVGRGEAQSYCILVPDTDAALENQRLLAMESTNDGFKLAEMDLAQRGPGDFLGTRQSGFDGMKLAELTNIRMVEKTRNLAESILEDDPTLTKPVNQNLVAELNRFWANSSKSNN